MSFHILYGKLLSIYCPFIIFQKHNQLTTLAKSSCILSNSLKKERNGFSLNFLMFKKIKIERIKWIWNERKRIRESSIFSTVHFFLWSFFVSQVYFSFSIELLSVLFFCQFSGLLAFEQWWIQSSSIQVNHISVLLSWLFLHG